MYTNSKTLLLGIMSSFLIGNVTANLQATRGLDQRSDEISRLDQLSFACSNTIAERCPTLNSPVAPSGFSGNKGNKRRRAMKARDDADDDDGLRGCRVESKMYSNLIFTEEDKPQIDWNPDGTCAVPGKDGSARPGVIVVFSARQQGWVVPIPEDRGRYDLPACQTTNKDGSVTSFTELDHPIDWNSDGTSCVLHQWHGNSQPGVAVTWKYAVGWEPRVVTGLPLPTWGPGGWRRYRDHGLPDSSGL